MLQNHRHNHSLLSRLQLKKIEDSSFNFLQMSVDEIRQLCFRTCQFNIGRFYAERDMNSDGDYNTEVATSRDISYVHVHIVDTQIDRCTKPGFYLLSSMIQLKHGTVSSLWVRTMWNAAAM